MRTLRLVAVLAIGATGVAPAQLAVTQPTEKLLVLPLAWTASTDSAAAIGISDAARDRLGQLARYKILLIPKSKICDALRASGFPCDGPMDARQAEQLARFLTSPSYTLGTLGHSTASYAARIHVVSGGSGFSSTFTVTGGAAGTAQPISEAIAQRLFTIVRAAENARNCNEQRGRNNVAKAIEEARKALAIDPTLAAAHLCLIAAYEIQRLGPDSTIVQAQAALRGDSLNGEAWNRLANGYLAKGDTAGWLRSLGGLVGSDIHNVNTAVGVGSLFLQHHRYAEGAALLTEVLAQNPGSQPVWDLKMKVCKEGSQWRCVLDMYDEKAAVDSSVPADTAALRSAIGAAQSIPDTQRLLRWARQAVRHYPTPTYYKVLAGAFEMAGQLDSALATYNRALQVDPSDVNLSLVIAKMMVDRAVYDTARATVLKRDTVALHAMQAMFATRVDSARPYVHPGLASSDSTQRLNAAVILLSAGSKVAQANAYDRAYPWLDTLLTFLAPRTPGDTVGARQQIRVQGSFWFGLSSVLSLGKPYADMIKSKSCEQLKVINERIQRTKQALFLGGRIAPQVATQMLGFVAQYEGNIPKAKQAWHCRNF